MIWSITSSLNSFKSFSFQPGLNILLADKSPGATDQQTRNRAGKTSIIEIIHFLLGAKYEKDSIFRKDILKNVDFLIDFDLRDDRILVSRRGASANNIFILKGNIDNWPISPNKDKTSGELFISNTNWRKVLGYLLFNLQYNNKKNKITKYNPTFRSLFSYFVRNENEGGFIDPTTQTKEQRLYDKQIAISFLLDLDWTISQNWQLVRDKEKTLKELKKAVGTGLIGEFIGTVSQLRTQLTLKEAKTRILKTEIENFKIHEEYHDLEKEASDLTCKISDHSNENLIDHELINDLEESLREEKEPTSELILKLYEETGVIFPKIISKRLEDLNKFHESIIQNRKSYLSSEIEDANIRIKNREKDIKITSERRSQIMAILNSHGALDHFNKLRSELSKLEAETETLRQKYIAAEQLESTKTELEIERKRLQIRLKQNFQEQKENLGKAILIFEEISEKLYGEPGSLTIEDTENGPNFEVHIHGQKSKGINNMQIFCFDMMLMQLCNERNIGPRFLVHDSHLFDGVDERQVAKAFQVGHEKAKELGFQYIITMNSDDIPVSFPQDFDINKYILPVRLTDATDEGGLFGFRFE
jgi:uncharacterized protein YydD (DUF2326 family)